MTEAELDTLAALFRAHLDPEHLAALATRWGVIGDLETLRKTATAGAADERLALTRAILAAAAARGLARWLVEEVLVEVLYWNSAFCEAAAPFTRSARDGASTLQAMLARRDNFLCFATLTEALPRLGPHVCMIVAEPRTAHSPPFVRGTGLLVGPDLVLTAAHVVAPVAMAGHPETLAAVFDYTAGDGALADMAAVTRRGLACVPVMAGGWKVALSPTWDHEGDADRLDGPVSGEQTTNLDMALLRLAWPVGLRPVGASGGPARGWHQPAMPGNLSYAPDARLIVVQHPGGFRRMVDFGRVHATPPGNTRVLSRVETAPGSSGAPCFDKDFRLVAVHNAAVQRRGVALRQNQAIRLDAGWSLIAPHLTGPAQPPPPPPPHWNAAPPGAPPAPILGRAGLIGWIAAAQAAAGAAPAQPAYVALAEGRGMGRSYTADILQTALTGRTDSPVIHFGNARQLLPDRAEDMAAHLARRLGAAEEAISELPPRPDPGRLEDDKLDRWVSHGLPEALAEALDAARWVVVDRVAAAQARIDSDHALGLATPAEIVALATSTDPPERRPRWREAWIVIDDLPDRPLSAECKSFVAALMGMDHDTASLPPPLAALRWLFLGHLPDFLRSDRAVIEDLAAVKVEAGDVAAVIGAAVAARGVAITPADILDEAERVATLVAQFDLVALEVLGRTHLQLAQGLVLAALKRLGVGRA